MPIYILVISAYVPKAMWNVVNLKFSFRDRDQMDLLFMILLELGIMFGNVCSSILYMGFRAFFNESFLQEEWAHG
jgi:hypothetical protein